MIVCPRDSKMKTEQASQNLRISEYSVTEQKTRIDIQNNYVVMELYTES